MATLMTEYAFIKYVLWIIMKPSNELYLLPKWLGNDQRETFLYATINKNHGCLGRITTNII